MGRVMKSLPLALPIVLAAGTGVIRTNTSSKCKEICVMVANCDTFTWSSTSLKCELKKHINKQYGIDLASCRTQFKNHQAREYKDGPCFDSRVIQAEFD